MTVRTSAEVGRRDAGPTLADAKRAAGALTAAGVARVVLFGSVAHGEATPRSDIDLLAIYDDLDYTQRWERRWELSSAAAAAAGYPVDVVVTDRAECKVRTERVHTSLEARAARYGVVLVDRAAGKVDWNKKMVMPVSDEEEAIERLGLAADALTALRRNLEPDSGEQAERQMRNYIRAFDKYRVRLLRAGGDAQAVVENSVKALIHLGASPSGRLWGHDIAKLGGQLVEPHRSNLPRLLEPHGADEISRWSIKSRYEAEGCGLAPDPEVATELARTACAVASYTTDQFPAGNPKIEKVRWGVVDVETYLEGYALDTGMPIRSRRRDSPGLDL